MKSSIIIELGDIKLGDCLVVGPRNLSLSLNSLSNNSVSSSVVYAAKNTCSISIENLNKISISLSFCKTTTFLLISQYRMQDQIGIPACFSSREKLTDNPAAITSSGQSIFISVYRTKFSDQCRLITVTWCKNLLLHELSVSVDCHGESRHTCKVELKPWCFWRKQGSKRFDVDGKAVDVFWDLKAARFNGETEPRSEYYVAVVCDEEVILLLGDMKNDAYRRTGCRPALVDPVLVSRKEHVFGKKKFQTRVKLHEKGRQHEISVEWKNRNGEDPEMEINVDDNSVIHVKHLQWKFRGNECIDLNDKVRIEVFWDVHDWLFSPGLRHALFIFKPVLASPSPSSPSTSSSPPFSSSSSTSTPFSSQAGSSSYSASSSYDFCLILYAWKVE